QHAPALVLALFSPALADRQPDWPPQAVVTGFPFYDQDGEAGMPAGLVRFLDAGPPPLVFTSGRQRSSSRARAPCARLGRSSATPPPRRLRCTSPSRHWRCPGRYQVASTPRDKWGIMSATSRRAGE